MGSLSNCLRKLGIEKHEAALLRGLVDDYLADGYEAHKAAVAAVDELIADLAAEQADAMSQIDSMTANNASPSFDATLEHAAAFAVANERDPWVEENRRLREEDKTLWHKAQTMLRRQFAPGGLLPAEVFKEKIARDTSFEVAEFDVQHLIGSLERAIKRDFGKRAGNLDEQTIGTLADALSGSVDDAIPAGTRGELYAMRQYLDGLSRQYVEILEAEVDALSLSFDEGERELFGAFIDAQDIYPTGDKPSDKAKATKERNDILNDAKERAKEIWGDGMQMRESLQKVAEAAEKAGRIRTILGNLGQYVHRSYRAFDDPDWFSVVPDHVLNSARQYLIDRYVDQTSESSGSPPGEMDYAEGERKAEVLLHEILKNGTAYDSMSAFIRESKLGAKDLSVLKRRKQIAPEIRALLGEYRDPRINFAKSATKMARLIWNQTFLNNVREMGTGNFLFEGDNRPPQATTQIAADGSEVYAPLNGLWTFPEIEQAFRDALGKEQMANWYRTVVQLNGAIKFGKTVLSPTTAWRNWQSAMFFALANGHFNFRHAAKSVSGLREYFTHNGKRAELEYLRKLKKLGVVYDTPYAGEMMRLLNDSKLDEHLFTGSTRMALRTALGYAQKFYQFGDDFWKIIGFENEKAMLIKHGGMSEAAAEVEAAERIRNTYPTYSMVGRAIQSLRRFPLAGTFVSFPAEIIRTSGHILKYAYKDMKNPDLRPLAIKRIAGIAIASSFAYALQEITKAALGMGDDEEEAVRRLAAPWQRNSNFFFTGRDANGNLNYFDISFLDPYNYWKRPLTAILRDQPWEDAAADVASETLKPFLGTDIAAQALYEIWANKKESGGQVYREHDAPTQQVIDITNHLRKALQPGIASNLERTAKALRGEVSPSGRKYDTLDEAAAWFGWRLSTLDPKVALYYRSFEFNDALSDATRALKAVATNPNKVSQDDLKAAYVNALDIRKRAFDEIGLIVAAARRSGLSDAKIHAILRNSNISIVNASAILMGKVPPWAPGDTTLRGAIKKAEVLFDKETAQEFKRRFGEVQRLMSSGAGG